MKTALVIGLGQFGSRVAKRMEELNCEVMAVDISENRVNDVLPYVTYAQIGDSTNQEFLRSLGIGNYDVCIVTLGSKFQSSLETTSLLKELGAKKVISRATNDVHMKFLLRNGADEVVYPEMQMAYRIATKYASDSVLDYIEIDDNYSIYELKVPKDWYGKTLVQLDVRRRYKVNVLTIKRNSEVFVPSPDSQILKDDIVLVTAKEADIQKNFKL